MSGRQIGSAVGFVVGLYVGNPQLGMAIGGMIGGAVDPDQIQGNKIGSVPAQRSNPGAPQPVVLGTSLVSDCLIMSQSEDMIVKEKTDPGKGSGTEVINEVLYRHVTIRVCRSSLAEDCAVQGIVTVYFDGNIVYDVTPESLLTPADNAKWKKDWTFYYGGPDQGTDPTEESYLGVGNVSAHRQICRVVGKRINLTDYGNRMPTVEVVVSACPVEPPNFLLVTGRESSPGDPVFASARVTDPLSFTPLGLDSGADLDAGTPANHNKTWAVVARTGARSSKDNRATWQDGSASSPYDFGQLIGGQAGWLTVIPEKGNQPSAYVSDGTLPLTFVRTAVSATSTTGADASAAAQNCPYIAKANGWYILCGERAFYRSEQPEGPYVAVWDSNSELDAGRAPNGACIVGWYDFATFGGLWYAVIEWHFDTALTRYQVIRSEVDIEDWTTFDILVDVAAAGANRPAQLVVTEDAVVCLNVDGTLWTSANGWASPITTGLSAGVTGPSGVVMEGGRRIVAVDNRVFIIDSDNCVEFNTETLEVSDPVPHGINAAIGITSTTAFIPGGGGVVIPDADGYYYDPVTGEQLGPDNGIAQLCGTTLANALRWLGTRGALEPAEIDASEQEDVPVRGITFQTTNTCKAELEPLRLAHFIDPADFDGALRFRTRGAEDVDMIIDPGALVFTEDEEEDSRLVGQDVEFPKRHHLEYLSLDLRYIRSTATSPDRISIDRSVVGESRASINEVFTKAEATYITAIQHKQQWMSREGGRKFGTGLECIQLVGASLISLDGKRGRIEQYSIDLNQIWFEKVPYDRASAMRARVVVAEAIGPRPPASQVRGPSISAVLNAPVMVDANDKAGIVWACCGPMRGWRGAQLQVRRAGGVWENGPIIDSPAVMGELTATLPAASRYVQDNTNVLRVTLYRDDAAMDSTDFSGLMAERNVWAIQYPDGTVELGQAQNSIEIADRQWELTGLMRGGLDTVPGEHLAGAKFILLTDALRFVAIRPDDVGKTLEFRAVSTGTDPDLAEVQAITFTTIESLREWQPYNIVVTPDGLGGYCVAWIGRARLGSSRTPIHSQWFEGYRVTFAFDGIDHVVDTAEASVCLSAAQMLDIFGVGYGAPVVTVRARSRVATNDDDFDSPPGSPGDPTSGSETFVAAGTWPGGYVGVPYVLRNGDADIVITGGYWDATAYGAIAPGVGALARAPLGSAFSIIGIPHTAGTFAAAIEVEATSPVAGHSGSAIVSNSVTIAATPAYSTIDTRLRENSRDRLIDTTPPWTTFELPSGSLYCYGFDTGDHWGEFTITGSTGPLVVGINVAIGELDALSSRPGLAMSFPNHAAVETTGDGTYAMSYDCASGAWEIFKLGTGSLASGTMALPSGNLARFVCTTNRVSPVQVKGNFGNEAWLYSPTGGQTGVPMPTLNKPASWNDRATPYRIMRGGNSFAGANVALRLRGPGHTFASPGKSSGRWRIGIFANGQRGLAVSTYDSAAGGLGAAGTANSIGYDGAWLRWCFGGVASAVAVTVPTPLYPFDVFALDMANSEVTLCYQDFDGNVTPLYTITGVPAGTWFPTESNSTNNPSLTYDPAGPSGFGDWL